MDDVREARDTGRLAVATGIVAICSAASLLIFFIVAGPFGTLNDIGNAATGVLSGWLAWRLGRLLPGSPTGAALALCLVGAAVAVVGSVLVISGATGFFLAGLVTTVGFAAIGVWLIALNRSVGGTAWSRGVRSLGLIAGALMVTGVITLPGILMGLDDQDTAPDWIWIGFIGWFATFFVYPAWAIWVGLVEMRASQRSAVADVVGRA
jgi:hypothetical protein